MKNKQPETGTEEVMLKLLRDVYGYDVLSFKLTGSEVVEMMAMTCRAESPKEKK